MRRPALLATVGVALFVVVAIPAAGLTAVAGTADAGQEAETAPGERLSGVVGIQEVELAGDLEQRTFGITVAQAASQDAQAGAVAEQLGTVEQRLAALEERRNQLEQQRESGEISEGRYRAEMARVAASSQTANQLANQTSRAAEQLPARLLEEHGVDSEAIQALKERARELRGGDVADIARDIAGPGVGHTPADDRPVELSDTGDDDDDDDGRGNGNDGHRGGNESSQP